MTQQILNFFARGKLLLTAEYFVMHGATALACPLKYGQTMLVSIPAPNGSTKDNYDSVLNWSATYQNKIWFSATFRLTDFSVQYTSDAEKAETLSRLLKMVRDLNPSFQVKDGTAVHHILEFNPQWGLGSSSTLISNMAEWAKVDPYLLNEKVFGGSGFDIACANVNTPVFYRKGFAPEPVLLDYPFHDKLFLVYSGKKKNTRDAVSIQLPEISDLKKEEISALSGRFSRCRKFSHFQELMQQHEQEVAMLTGQIPVQQQKFADFDGTVKSLGAWGGDFFLVATRLDPNVVKDYFSAKEMNTVFRWKDLVR